MNTTVRSFHLALVFSALCVLPALAQNPAPVTQEAIDARVAAQQKDKSLFDVYKDGGIWMHPILLTSLAAVAFTGFCAVMVRKSRIMPPQLVNDLNHLLQQRQVSQAHQVCLAQNNPLASVMAAAVVKANLDAPMFNKPAMEAAAAEALAAEEARLGIWVNYLNVCAQIAPMLGLFGTVVGMIESFNQLAAGKSEPADLAGGIGVAMTTTAGGLLVAIPSMCLYFFFRSQLTRIMTDLQKTASRMLDLFTGEMNPDGSRPPTGYTTQIPTH